jgi:D-sedoheptulose 7-phosphate isomerase
MNRDMKEQFSEGIQNLTKLLEDVDFQLRVEKAISIISKCLGNGLPLLVFGNGGSASDALHISGELVGRFNLDRKGLNVVCLNSNVTVMTAWSNDVDYKSVFSRQVESHGKVGGVAWGLTTSGNSASVVNALSTARNFGMSTIALTGLGGGKAREFADVLLDVPATITPRVQELHLPVYHFMCQEIEKNCV